jgi:hypothetical protein
VSGELHEPAALPPGKSPRYPLDRSWVDPGGGLDDMEKRKFLSHRDLNSNTLVVQPVASRYSDYALPALRPSIRVGLLTTLASKTSDE